MKDEQIVIDPAQIADAINAIKRERNIALEAMENINREYDFLSDTMGSETLTAARDFQITADQLFARVNETVTELEAVAAEYSAQSVHIDHSGATGVLNI